MDLYRDVSKPVQGKGPEMIDKNGNTIMQMVRIQEGDPLR
jgi:hypothetical protein